MTARTELAAALANANLQAFLRVIRAGESSQDDGAYTMMFGGKHFDSFADHPRQAMKSPWGWTSAAGAYQAMCAVPGKVKTDTWGDFTRACGRSDFSPESQDLFAVWCISRRHALDDALAGRFSLAIAKCAREWASLPGSPYGQPTRTLEQALATYLQFGGRLAEESPSAPAAAAPAPTIPTLEPAAEVPIASSTFPWPAAAPATTPPTPEPIKEPAMPLPLVPILGALLPSVVEAIPKLGALFGSGGEVQQRNVKAAELAVQIVQDAVGARNAQEAVEMISADPELAKAATKAVEDNWFRLTEAGGGGIDGARKADQAARASAKSLLDAWKSPSLIVACLLLPLVYLVVLSLIGVIGSAEWSPEVRASLAGLIVGSIIGGLIGYYYGQTTSNNRTPLPAQA